MTILIIIVIYIAGVFAARYMNKKLNNLNSFYESTPWLWIFSWLFAIAISTIIVEEDIYKNYTIKNKIIRWFIGSDWNKK